MAMLRNGVKFGPQDICYIAAKDGSWLGVFAARRYYVDEQFHKIQSSVWRLRVLKSCLSVRACIAGSWLTRFHLVLPSQATKPQRLYRIF